MIMCERVPCRLPVFGLVALGLLALAVLPGWSLAQRPAQPALVPVQAEPPKAPIVNQTPVALDFGFQQPGTVKPAPAERDRKLQELEQKVQAILREIRSLRGTQTAYPAIETRPPFGQHAPATLAGQTYYVAVREESQQIMLTRTTY